MQPRPKRQKVRQPQRWFRSRRCCGRHAYLDPANSSRGISTTPPCNLARFRKCQGPISTPTRCSLTAFCKHIQFVVQPPHATLPHFATSHCFFLFSDFGGGVVALLLSSALKCIFSAFSVFPKHVRRLFFHCSPLCAIFPLYSTQYQLPHTHLTECNHMLCCDVTKDETTAVVFRLKQPTCMFAMFKCSLSLCPLRRSPVCKASSRFCALPLRMSLLTTHLLCSRVPCWVGLRHGRSVQQKDQDKLLGADADIGLHLHGSYNQGECAQDRGHNMTGTFGYFLAYGV